MCVCVCVCVCDEAVTIFECVSGKDPKQPWIDDGDVGSGDGCVIRVREGYGELSLGIGI